MQNDDMAGRIMAHAFNDELEKIAREKNAAATKRMVALASPGPAGKKARDLRKLKASVRAFGPPTLPKSKITAADYWKSMLLDRAVPANRFK